MTIDVTKVVSPDLFVENDSLLLDPHRVAPHLEQIPTLAAVTFRAPKSGTSPDPGKLASACGKEAISLLMRAEGKARHIWLFVSDGPWSPITRVVRHNRLWRGHRHLIESTGVLRVSDEVQFLSGEGVRFAGLLELTGEAVDKAMELVRTNSACALICSARVGIDSQASIRSIFCSAFPKKKGLEQTSIDWMTLAIDLCTKGDYLIRVSGLFDDPDVAVDVIGTQELILRLVHR